MSTRLKDGITTDKTGQPVEIGGQLSICGKSLTVQKNLIFFWVIMKSVTADGSLRSPTGGVKGMYPAPHIHEQMTTSNYGYDIAYNFTHNNIMLEHKAMNNMNTVAHMDVHNTQY